MSRILDKLRGVNLTTVASISGIVLAVAAIVVPIIWDVHRETAALEVHLLSAVSLVDESVATDKLQVLYDGKPFTNVMQLHLAVFNRSRVSIRANDFIEPIKVTFWPRGPTNPSSPSVDEVLDARITRAEPSDVEAVLTILPNRQSISLQSSLLNPGDLIERSVVVSGSPPVALPIANGRVADISRISVVDKRPDLQSPEKNKLARRTILKIASVLVGLAALLFFFLYAKIAQLDRRLRDGTLALPGDATQFEMLAFINTHLNLLKDSETFKTMIRLLSTIPSTDKVDKQLMRIIEQAIQASLAQWRQTKFAPHIFAVFSIVGFLYILFEAH